MSKPAVGQPRGYQALAAPSLRTATSIGAPTDLLQKLNSIERRKDGLAGAARPESSSSLRRAGSASLRAPGRSAAAYIASPAAPQASQQPPSTPYKPNGAAAQAGYAATSTMRPSTIPRPAISNSSVPSTLPSYNSSSPSHSNHAPYTTTNGSSNTTTPSRPSNLQSTLQSPSTTVGKRMSGRFNATGILTDSSNTSLNGTASLKSRNSYNAEPSPPTLQHQPSVNSAESAAAALPTSNVPCTKISQKQALALPLGSRLVVNGREGRLLYVGTLSFLSGTIIGLCLSQSHAAAAGVSSNMPLVDSKHVSLSVFSARDVRQALKCPPQYAYFVRTHSVVQCGIPTTINIPTQRWRSSIHTTLSIIRMRKLPTAEVHQKLAFRTHRLIGHEDELNPSTDSNADQQLTPVQRDAKTYDHLDVFVTTVPKNKSMDLVHLTTYLTRHNNVCKSDIERVRVLYRWCCEYIQWRYHREIEAIYDPPTNNTQQTHSNHSNHKQHHSKNPLADNKPHERRSSLAAIVQRTYHVADEQYHSDDEEVEAKTPHTYNKRNNKLQPSTDDTDDEPQANHKPTNPHDAMHILRTRSADSYGMAILFATLCHNAGIDSVVVHGIAKERCFTEKIGERLQQCNHSWNAVFIDSQWLPLDICLSNGFFTSPNDFHKSFSHSYFLPTPDVFIKNHFPLRCEAPPNSTSQRCRSFVSLGTGRPEKLQMLPLASPVQRTQFTDLQWISRSYIDLCCIVQAPSHITRIDNVAGGLQTLVLENQCTYTIQMVLPSTVDVSVDVTLPTMKTVPSQTIGQLYQVNTTPMSTATSHSVLQQVTISLVFPVKGLYHCTIKQHAYNYNTNTFGKDETLFGLRFHIPSAGLLDIRNDNHLAVGYLQKLVLVGREYSVEKDIEVRRPNRGYIEGGDQHCKFQLMAPSSVSSMVVVNNGSWVRLQAISGQNNSATVPSKSSTVAALMPSQPLNKSAPALLSYEGELRIHPDFTDVQVYYQIQGQSSYNLLYVSDSDDTGTTPVSSTSNNLSNTMNGWKANTTASAAQPPTSPRNASSQLSPKARTAKLLPSPTNGRRVVAFAGVNELSEDDGESSLAVDDRPSASNAADPMSTTAPAVNKHGKVILDSRGVCFEQQISVLSIICGKKTVNLRCEVGSDVTLRGELRSGWSSGVKVNGNNVVRIKSVSSNVYEIQCTLPNTGYFTVHVFISTSGSGVSRFAFMTYVKA